jgi:hypothetical protein
VEEIGKLLRVMHKIVEKGLLLPLSSPVLECGVFKRLITFVSIMRLMLEAHVMQNLISVVVLFDGTVFMVY